MIAHVVMLKFKLDRDEAVQEIKQRLDMLPAMIPEIVYYEVGLNELGSDRAFDLVLYSKFASYDDLKTYNNHPEHVSVLQLIGQHVEKAHSVDYTLPE